ncbi:aldo/keto reductase [Streptococcus equinus]|uniref:aldo/keto reductase n=1 Tax=Streptococcus equinus TaxID=1335 RepID=UPI003BF8BC66
MKSIQLNNGVEMPKIGYGVYQIPPMMTQRCVKDAIEVGYRSIDTAQCYGNEKAVGKAIKNSAIPREDIFLTTKQWGSYGYRDTLASIDGSLKKLSVDYIDLFLLHEPSGDNNERYRALEDAQKAGKVRAIGLSNFLGDNYDNLLSNCQVIPQVNQIETHVFRQQNDFHNRMKVDGVVHESWAPMAEGQNGFFYNDTLTKIAQKYNRTVAQVGLRWLYQKDIVVIPKSTHIERMRENISIEDFELSLEDMKLIEQLDTGRSYFGWW